MRHTTLLQTYANKHIMTTIWSWLWLWLFCDGFWDTVRVQWRWW